MNKNIKIDEEGDEKNWVKIKTRNKELFRHGVATVIDISQFIIM